MFTLRTLCKFTKSMLLKNNIHRSVPRFKKTNQNVFLRLSIAEFCNQCRTPKVKCYTPSGCLLAWSMLTWLGFSEEDLKKESELIMTLKKAVLNMEREQHDLAEQFLHLALRLAQQQQNRQGVLYCYDLMANLALNRHQYKKAETLFIEVCKMLLQDGIKEDDLKVIHISLKLAIINQMNGNHEKAGIGFEFCLQQIEKQKYDDANSKELYGIILDNYAAYLVTVNDLRKSLECLKEAYEIFKEMKGTDVSNYAENMAMLNDLGISSWKVGDIQSAKNYLNEAVTVGKKMEDQTHLGVPLANLGLLYVYNGLTQIAQNLCKEAWKLGMAYNEPNAMQLATLCFEEIKTRPSQ